VLFRPAWHLVGTTQELAHPGDFLTCELLGQPVQVRNFLGQLHALSNVCAHRHCLVSSASHGHSRTMRCQYHGWEYGEDGATRRIPEPRNFAPIDSELLRLPKYRVETCGALVFVSLLEFGPTLAEHLGPIHGLCAERFGDGWRPFLNWKPDYPANWKVPVENSLEAYHVPAVHDRTFGSDPGERRSTHTIGKFHTSFHTTLPFNPHSRGDVFFQRCEAAIVGRRGGSQGGTYEQHHSFPNLLFSFTDAISLCHCVLPTGPRTSQAVIRQFGWVGNRPGVRHWLAGRWGHVAAHVTRRILLEDTRLYAAIQRGLEASEHPGVLGRCEERIHALQAYVRRATGAAAAPSPAACDALIGAEG
jgi:phenylpropionate dioxygenase-like ring-hydroxylating dioxygenase large terminal subunit